MTEDYRPTDNAIAERVNGTLKTEVVYRERRFKSISDARERIASSSPSITTAGRMPASA
ncbi:MAG: integrase core domain-containing protein [Prevotella sp.]|nr:integrase core domain-containing protein [Prevotella sp.]